VSSVAIPTGSAAGHQVTRCHTGLVAATKWRGVTPAWWRRPHRRRRGFWWRRLAVQADRRRCPHVSRDGARWDAAKACPTRGFRAAGLV